MKQTSCAVALATALVFMGAVALPAGAQTTDPAAPAATAPSANPTTSPPVAEAKSPAEAGSPNLVVATVKLDGGWRASKLIGASVYDDTNNQVGSVDDLIVAGADKISVAIVSVGGFLGIGSKLVAIPYDHLRYDPNAKDAKVVMPGATKESLNQMPGFTYGSS